MLVLVPAAPFTGETVAVEREMSEEEEREARRIAFKRSERKRNELKQRKRQGLSFR